MCVGYISINTESKMNNKLAVNKILNLKDSDLSPLEEYKNLLKASTVLPKEICKIAIVGRQSKGKSDLINLLSKENIPSKTTIHIPIYISSGQNIKESTEGKGFCWNNNVKSIVQNGSFYWTNSRSQEMSKNQTLDQIMQSPNKAAGIFIEYSNPNHEIAKRAALLIPPDIPANENFSGRQKQILNAIDVADIILLVMSPAEINSGIYDFLYKSEVINKKPVIIFIVHNEISNFFHYPLSEQCDDAKNAEKRNMESAKCIYDAIQAPYTSDIMSQNLKEGIEKDTQNLLQEIEILVKENFSKTKLKNVYFLPTEEIQSSHKITEDQKIINNVKKWQFEKIYSGIVQVSSEVANGETPVIAWEYFFRKCEDICFDTLSPKVQNLKRALTEDYSNLKIIDNLLKVQKDEIKILLRDYSGTIYDTQVTQMEKLFCDYQDKKVRILGISLHSNNTLSEIKTGILDIFNRTAYPHVLERIRQQYNFVMPTGEQIIDKALAVANKREDASCFSQYIRENISPIQIVKNWEESSPLASEKRNILSKHHSETSTLKQKIKNVIDEWISISEFVDYRNEISFMVQKREELDSFSPEKLF